MSEKPRIVVPPEAAGERLDRFLARELAESRTAVAQRIDTGAVTVDGRPVARSLKLRGGELLELEPDCKWVLAASAFLSEQLASCGDGGGGGEAAAHAEKLQALGRVDPMRSRYYADRASAAAAAATPVLS